MCQVATIASRGHHCSCVIRRDVAESSDERHVNEKDTATFVTSGVGTCMSLHRRFDCALKALSIRPDLNAALALSGGPDSLALAILASNWLHRGMRPSPGVFALLA